jgi:hypothetical protein
MVLPARELFKVRGAPAGVAALSAHRSRGTEPALSEGMDDRYEGNYLIRGRGALAFLAVAFVAFVGFLIYSGTHSGGYQERARDVSGTSGRVAGLPRGEESSGVSGSAVAHAVISELETITGAVDGHELVGRRVDLRAELGEAAGNANASGRFWVGSADNAVLVVLGRDVRNEHQRITGESPDHPLGEIKGGQPVLITGQVERVPKAEQMYSWNLTRQEKTALADRPVYIRADSVRPVSEDSAVVN